MDHILIRDGSIIVRVPKGLRELSDNVCPDFFDVRTGSQIYKIFPRLQSFELHRGYLLSETETAIILRHGKTGEDVIKVITLLEVKQRKLDTVVADSILDQLR